MPIAVALDLHGNVTQKMIDNADVIVSFKTYPHVDMYETGEHAGRILFDWLAGGPRPRLAWRRLPLMTHTLRSNTAEGAMRRAVQAARGAEAGGMLGVSVLAGFALADIPDPCLSVIVVAAGDADAADRVAAGLAAAIWDDRDGFVYETEPWPPRSTAQSPWRAAPTVPCCCWTTATTACPAAPATPWTC